MNDNGACDIKDGVIVCHLTQPLGRVCCCRLSPTLDIYGVFLKTIERRYTVIGWNSEMGRKMTGSLSVSVEPL